VKGAGLTPGRLRRNHTERPLSRVTRDNSNLVVEVGALRLPLGLHPGVPGLKLTGQASKAPVITVLVQITVGPFTNLAGWLRKPKIPVLSIFSKISVLASVLVAWI
jgi:hypothetical protein